MIGAPKFKMGHVSKTMPLSGVVCRLALGVISLFTSFEVSIAVHYEHRKLRKDNAKVDEARQLQRCRVGRCTALCWFKSCQLLHKCTKNCI